MKNEKTRQSDWNQGIGTVATDGNSRRPPTQQKGP